MRLCLTAAFALSHRTRFVHHHRSSHELFVMARIDRLLGSRVVVCFDEAEASSLPGKAVAHDRHRIHIHACVCEEILDIRFVRTVREIPHKKLLHGALISQN